MSNFYYNFIEKGLIGVINTCYNTTAPLINSDDPYQSECAQIAIDSIYDRIIVGYKTNANRFGATYFDYINNYKQMEKDTTQNVAIVSYSSYCKVFQYLSIN